MPLFGLVKAELAFDHAMILRDAIDWLAATTTPSESLLAFLPEIFEGADLKALFTYLGRPTSDIEPWCLQAIAHDLCERLPGRKKRYRSLVEDFTEFSREDLKE